MSKSFSVSDLPVLTQQRAAVILEKEGGLQCLWQLGRDGSECIVAIFDPDNQTNKLQLYGALTRAAAGWLRQDVLEAGYEIEHWDLEGFPAPEVD